MLRNSFSKSWHLRWKCQHQHIDGVHVCPLYSFQATTQCSCCAQYHDVFIAHIQGAQCTYLCKHEPLVSLPFQIEKSLFIHLFIHVDLFVKFCKYNYIKSIVNCNIWVHFKHVTASHCRSFYNHFNVHQLHFHMLTYARGVSENKAYNKRRIFTYKSDSYMLLRWYISCYTTLYLKFVGPYLY